MFTQNSYQIKDWIKCVVITDSLYGYAAKWGKEKMKILKNQMSESVKHY